MKAFEVIRLRNDAFVKYDSAVTVPGFNNAPGIYVAAVATREALLLSEATDALYDSLDHACSDNERASRMLLKAGVKIFPGKTFLGIGNLVSNEDINEAEWQ